MGAPRLRVTVNLSQIPFGPPDTTLSNTLVIYLAHSTISLFAPFLCTLQPFGTVKKEKTLARRPS